MTDVCFVCLEPTTEQSGCSCKVTAHAACLIKVVRSGGLECGICKTNISNVVQEQRLVPQCTTGAVAKMGFATGGTALLLLSVAYLALAVDKPKKLPVFLSCAAGFACVGFLSGLLAGRVHVAYGAQAHVVARRVEIHAV